MGGRRAELTLAFHAKASRIYTEARVNNSHSNVYRGDFRNIRKRCVRFTHATLLIAETLGNIRKCRFPYMGIAGCRIWASYVEMPGTSS